MLESASKLLQKYREKRSFGKTPEPSGAGEHRGTGSFVVQRHSATRLHYDFRLEVDGVLKSWAVPKGPPLGAGEKRLAIQVEDHPLDYAKFEGVIPKGNYGAGDVRIWDRGTFKTEGSQPAGAQIENGEIKFSLHGTRLQGRFVLVKMRNSRRQNEWLFIRKAAGSEVAAVSTAPGTRGRTNAAARVKAPRKTRKGGSIADPGTLTAAVRAPMPSKVNVAVATLADKPFSDDGWLFEIKWDGERAVVWTKDNGVTIRSRSHRDITDECPELRDFARKLSAREAIVDGEIVALDDSGRSDFKKLQPRFGVQNPSPTLLAQAPIVYYAFDILYCDGYDLRRTPLIERKEFLQRLLQTSPAIRYSDHQVGEGERLFEVARKQQLEGLIAKKMDSEYVEGRSRFWLKIKIVHDLDVVIGGWTAPRRSRDYFGALLMGLYRGSQLRYIGSVGTGFDRESLAGIHARLQKLETAKSPFKHVPKVKEKITWVQPKLVARVKFAEWTTDLKLRQPVFLGFQNDRDAAVATLDEQRKKPEPSASRPKGNRASSKRYGEPNDIAERAPARATTFASAKFTSTRGKSIENESALEAEISEGTAESLSAVFDGKEVSLSHLNKVYFPEAGCKKRDLLLHYLRMSKYVLPFLKDRPLVLKRYPNGIHGSFFFQKEAPRSRPEWMRTVSIYSKERSAEMEYFVADDLASLLYLTNLGCIDHNPWSSRVGNLDKPDYVFFDFDPTEGTGFDAVVELARSTELQLKRLGMRSFLKTSGATGFHIYVPLRAEYSYEQVQMFAAAVAGMVKREYPDVVTFERSIKKRKKGSVLIDTVQNARGKPLATAYSVRPVASVAVSTPVSPKDLSSKLRPDSWTIETIGARVKRVGDLWADFWKHRQRLEEAVSKAK